MQVAGGGQMKIRLERRDGARARRSVHPLRKYEGRSVGAPVLMKEMVPMVVVPPTKKIKRDVEMIRKWLYERIYQKKRFGIAVSRALTSHENVWKKAPYQEKGAKKIGHIQVAYQLCLTGLS